MCGGLSTAIASSNAGRECGMEHRTLHTDGSGIDACTGTDESRYVTWHCRRHTPGHLTASLRRAGSFAGERVVAAVPRCRSAMSRLELSQDLPNQLRFAFGERASSSSPQIYTNPSSSQFTARRDVRHRLLPRNLGTDNQATASSGAHRKSSAAPPIKSFSVPSPLSRSPIFPLPFPQTALSSRSLNTIAASCGCNRVYPVPNYVFYKY